MLRIGIIGSGFGVIGLLPAFDSISGCKVVAICAKSSEPLTLYSARTGIQALPLQKTIAQRFEARIDKATVTFQSMQGSVNLEGRVWAQADPQTFADLILMGGIQDVEIEKSTGTSTLCRYR